jgi:hypothetical protein
MALQKAHFSERYKFLFPEAFLAIKTVSTSPPSGENVNVPGPAGTAAGEVNPNANKHRLDVQFSVFANREAAEQKGELIETITKTYYVDAVTNVYAQAESEALKDLEAISV